MSDNYEDDQPKRRERTRRRQTEADSSSSSAASSTVATPSGTANANNSSSANLFSRLVTAQDNEETWKKEGGNFMWVPEEEECYVVGEITERRGEDVEVTLENGNKKTVPITSLLPMNPPKLDRISDMVRLSHLNEATILYNLRRRYENDLIYTYSGLFLVAINPYKRLPIYNPEHVEKHRGKRREEVDPHVFAIAEDSYRQMLQNKQNQSMLITGESGAGKTENTKKVIQYLTAVAGSSGGGGKLEQQLLRTNPLLEAFGNAKTNKNDNSSRFGKFIEIDFNAAGYIVGTKIQNYLLETTRVTGQALNERNFHFFYQVCSDPAAKAKYQLGPIESYHYLNQSGCTFVEGVDDKKEFQETMKAMEVIGMDENERDVVSTICASILHMGNIVFAKDNQGLAVISDKTELNIAAKLLEIDGDKLGKAFTNPKLVTKNETIETHVTVEQASANRNALVKSLYSRLFDWLVRRINVSLVSKEAIKNFIGVLDIAGFEIFEVNSFEQLCINYTNEKLQQFFNHHMFKKEQDEYLKEKIEWKLMDFGLDLQPTIDLIEKPLGILAIVDQQTFLPGTNAESLVNEMNNNHKDKPIFKIHKMDKDKFTLTHYAANVTYTTKNWLVKNIDPVNDDCKSSMYNSKKGIIRSLFDLQEEKAAQQAASKSGPSGARFNTVASQYKKQLKELMQVLESTEPHFIRCIVPNLMKKPGIIQAPHVLDQLRCNGVVEGIRISRKGYPGRIPFAEFLQRYELLAKSKADLANEVSIKGKSKVIMKSAGFVEGKHFAIGVTKVFLRAGVEATLEELREAKISQVIVTAQAAIRGCFGRRDYARLKDRIKSIAVIQKNWRSYMQLKDWAWWSLFQRARPFIDVFQEEQKAAKTKKEMEDLKKKIEQEEEAKKALEAEKSALNQQIAKLQAEAQVGKEQQQNIIKNVGDLKSKISELEDVIENVKRQKSDLEENRLRLQQVIQEKEEKLQQKLQEMDELFLKASSTQKDADFFKKSMADRDSSIAKLETRLKHLEAELKDTKNKHEEEMIKGQELDRIKRSLDEKLKELNFSLEAVTKQRIESDNKVKKLENDLKTSGNDNRTLKQNLEQVQTDLQKLKVDLEKREDDLKQKIKEYDDMEAIKKKNDIQLRELNDSLAEETRKRNQLETKMRHLKGDATEAQSLVAQLTEQNHNLEDNLNTSRNEIQGLKQQILSLEENKMQLETAKSNLDKQFKNETARLNGELERSKSELDRVNKKSEEQIRDLSDQLAELQAQKAALEAKLKQAEQNYRNLKRQYDDLLKEKEDADKKIVKLEVDLQEAKNAIESEKKRTSDLEREKRDLINEKKAIESELEAERENAGRVDNKSKSVATQLAQEKEKLSALESERDDLNRVRSDLENQLRNMKSDLESQRAENLGLKSQNEQLNNNLKDLQQRADDLEAAKNKAETTNKNINQQVEELNNLLEAEKQAKQNLDRKRAALESEVKRLTQRVDEEIAKGRTDTQKREQVEAQLRQAEVEKGTKDSSISDLLRKIKQLEDALQKAQSEGNDNNNNLNKTKREVAELKAKVVELEAALEEAQNNAAATEKFEKDIASKTAEFQSKLEAEKQKRTIVEVESNKLKVEIERVRDEMQGEVKKAQQSAEKFKQQVSDVESDLTKQLKRSQEESAELKKEIRALQKELSRTPQPGQGQVDQEALDKVRRDFELQLAKLSATLNEEKNLRSESEGKRRDQELAYNELRDRLETETRSIKKLQAQRKALEIEVEEYRELAEQSEDLKEELSHLKSQTEKYISTLKEELQSERAQRIAVDETISNLRRENQQLRMDLDAERSKESNHANKIKSNLETELQDMEQMLVKAKQDKAKAAKLTQQLERELREAERKYDQEQRDKADVAAKLSSVERELKKLRTDADLSSRNSVKFESENNRLYTELNSYKDRCQELEDQLEKLRNQMNSDRSSRSSAPRDRRSTRRFGDEDF